MRLVEIEHTEQRGEIRRVPAAIEIGVAEADFAALEDVADDLLRMDVEHAMRARLAALEMAAFAVWQTNVDAADAHAAQHVQQTAQAEPGAAPGPWLQRSHGRASGRESRGQSV